MHSVKTMGQDVGMTVWFRTYCEDEGPRTYFEAGDEGWAVRQVKVRGQGARPVTAVSPAEVAYLRDHADPAAGRCGRQYGVPAEGPLDGRQSQSRAAGISAQEFERL